MQHYELRAESRAAIIAMLGAAQTGKARPFLVQDETGDTQVDASRIRYPYEEMTEDEEPAPTGFWLCEIWLEEPDAELAAMAL
ncbi:hypothetical protein [Parvibaculum sp.]|jgi:hypothetical protein|uniref:hypothetical protein n=1 Tax=Parvibaculum sp. TaxID=2024848 RepID=UPI000C6B77B9|nr:hypothetical protein [Parvibaculum sp.]HAC58847.1 hypothetical protein [Rhodobiaceae bacterium]MAU59479.1 hypothetical protein [Parvibaculum sp.]MBO6667990.1 hypothetical protein [Parvibaculum sp.]MBO6690603.1 hypothetical protein [Parvibaculum sp.]MBO6714774.1 hypothetical protein [Parvibaculum sp.]|tara:strand:- start:5408 stop:5656 length:249 start_codon:yes stop_codon:yes gene_type:complete